MLQLIMHAALIHVRTMVLVRALDKTFYVIVEVFTTERHVNVSINAWFISVLLCLILSRKVKQTHKEAQRRRILVELNSSRFTFIGRI